MRRASRLRPRVPIGRASRRRIRSGGPLALGRPAATLEAWREIRAQGLARAHWVCHAQTDAPYARGRLVITPLGNGRFTIDVTRGADKWAIRA